MLATVCRACVPLIALALMLPSVGQAQICRDDILASTPDSRFLINSDGTVHDTATDLIWKRCAEGQTDAGCAGDPTHYTWQQALQLAAQARFADYSDWRLPDINELQSIVEQRCFDPAINLRIFPNTRWWLWSASPRDSSRFQSSNPTFLVWAVNFYTGDVTTRSHNYGSAVRLVRGGP